MLHTTIYNFIRRLIFLLRKKRTVVLLPYFSIQNNFFVSKEFNEFSFSKLDSHKNSVMNEIVTKEQLASIFSFLSNSGETSAQYQKALDFLNS